QRVLSIVVGDRTGGRPPDAHGDPAQMVTRCRRNRPGDVDLLRLLGNGGGAHHQRQQHTQSHSTKETLTLSQVVHGGVLIMRVFAWPSGRAWRSARDTS